MDVRGSTMRPVGGVGSVIIFMEGVATDSNPSTVAVMYIV